MNIFVTLLPIRITDMPYLNRSRRTDGRACLQATGTGLSVLF